MKVGRVFCQNCWIRKIKFYIKYLLRGILLLHGSGAAWGGKLQSPCGHPNGVKLVARAR